MTHRFTCCSILTLTLTFTFTLAAFAQKPGGGGGGAGAGTGSSGGRAPSAPSPTRSPTSTSPSLNGPDSGLSQKAFITGKVVLDDGTQLTESADIQTICQGHKQTVTHTDSRGGFSFELGDRISAAAAGVASADTDSPVGGMNGQGLSGGIRRDWRNCEILAALPGFTSQSVDLSSHLNTFETTDIGRLVLHRMGQVQGFTISATTAAAPRDAQKAYEKGREKASKEKWDEAQQLVTKAVEIYPKYAIAWFDLGRIQLHTNNAVQARHSFEQSIAADPKYTNPYRGLAELDVQQKQWQPLVTITDQLVALDPVSYPDAWFRNALGNLYLGNLAAAEKSARQGVKVDSQHQIPKLEYLLGVILLQERNYTEAGTHIQNYLKIATAQSDIDDAQKQLAEITRLSASVQDPASANKK